MLHYLPALTHPSSSPFLILVRQNSSTTQVLVFPHDSHFFLLILVWKSLDQIGSTAIYTCNNHPQPQNFIGFNPVDDPRSLSHTHRKKEERFFLPTLSFPEASKHITVPYYWVASRRGRRRKAVQGYLVPVGLAEDWAPFMEERSAATVTFVNLLGVVLSSSHCWWQRWILFSYLLEIPE